MNPFKMKLSTLFETKRRYVVPLYQRPYVWTREEQWIPLWDDITSKVDEVIASGENDEIGTHFLGAAVINQIKTSIAEVTAYSIIDGQQRLTTLQILLFAFRSFLKEIKYPEQGILEDLTQLTINTGSRDKEIEKYKVWPTIADQSTFETIFSLTSPADLDNDSGDLKIASSALVDAYRFFYERIDEYVRFGENDDEIDSPEYSYDTPMAHTRINAIMDTLRRHLEIVVIELEKGDDPQIIFETLNARGVPLLPSDLIRNFVFMQATNNKEDVDRLYDEYWRPYDDYEHGQAGFWKKEVEQGRIKRPRIDLFMYYYLILRTGQDIKITNLFQEFRRWWHRTNKQNEKVESFLKDIKKLSRTYHRLMTPIPEHASRLGVFMDRLQSMDTATVYPLLLLLYGGDINVAPTEIDIILTILESYLVRRMICLLSAKNYNRAFLSVLRDLRRAEEINSTLFRDILAGFEGDAVRWPSDEDLQHYWLTAPLYRRLARSRLRMILEAIDLQLETNKQERIHIEGDLTIEHIFPQSPDHNIWGELQDPNLIHSVGNLTMLTQELNSSISNGPFVNKRPAIAQQSRLRMNVYFQQTANKETWTQDDIETRGKTLLEVAKSIWTSPPDQARVRIAPSKQHTINTLCATADANGIGASFRFLHDTALRLGLHPRTDTSSIMYSPPQNKNFALFTAWVKPPKPKFLRVYLASETFSKFMSVSIEDVERHLGKEGWRELSEDDANSFTERLESLLKANRN